MHSASRRGAACGWLLRLELMIAGLLLGLALLWNTWRHLGLRHDLAWSWWYVLLGFLAALPPLGTLVVLEASHGRHLPWIEGFRESLVAVLVPLLREIRVVDILLLSVLAGFSEEVFFRGVLQREMGLALTSLVFGVLHAVSIPYMLWAALMGLYLGCLVSLAESLWLPIVTHTVIDGVGLYYIRFVLAPRHPAALSAE